MMETMLVRAEVWPLAADAAGIWLISGDDAWRPELPIYSDGDIHFEIETLLWSHGVAENVTMIHSTSWRPDGPALMITYVAVIKTEGSVLSRWPDARPVGLPLAEAVGQPPRHEPTDPPIPRYIDVLIHAVRHLKFLLETDDVNGAVLTLPWRRHLENLQPAIARMYRESA